MNSVSTFSGQFHLLRDCRNWYELGPQGGLRELHLQRTEVLRQTEEALQLDVRSGGLGVQAREQEGYLHVG